MIYVRTVDGSFNKEELINYKVEVFIIRDIEREQRLI